MAKPAAQPTRFDVYRPGNLIAAPTTSLSPVPASSPLDEPTYVTLPAVRPPHLIAVRSDADGPRSRAPRDIARADRAARAADKERRHLARMRAYQECRSVAWTFFAVVCVLILMASATLVWAELANRIVWVPAP
jgi:hypothetical protein